MNDGYGGMFALLSAALRDTDTARVCAAAVCPETMPSGYAEAFTFAKQCAKDTGRPALEVYGLEPLESLSAVDQDRIIGMIGQDVQCPTRSQVQQIFDSFSHTNLSARLAQCKTKGELTAVCKQIASAEAEGSPLFTGIGGSPKAMVDAAFSDRPVRMLEGCFAPAIAPILEGAITPDSLTVFCGPAKIGKSGLLCDIGMMLAERQFRTRYYTLGDDGAEAITRRCLRTLSHRPLKGDYGCDKTRTKSYHICDTAACGECADCEGNVVLDPYPTEKLLKASDNFQDVVSSYGPIGVCPRANACPKYRPRVWWAFSEPPQAVDRKTFDILPGWFENNLDIRYVKKGRCAVADVEATCDGFDAVIVDYADMMRFTSDRDADFERFQAVWEDLRNLAHDRKIAIISATQANRGGAGAVTQNVNTLGRTKTVGDNATSVIGINQTKPEKTRKIIRLNDIVAREFDYSEERHAEICIDPGCGVWLTGESRTVYVYDDGNGGKK